MSVDDELTGRARTRVGTVLKAKYRLDRLLGVGGMAAVYQATHTRNAGKVALKILHREFSLDRDLRARFLREGYAANVIEHPGAIRILDDDAAEDGSAFLVMELLEGETLDARWERRGRRLGVGEVVSIVTDLLDVLAAAHAKGIVHRDLKPENLFVTRDSTLKVLDFGIARLGPSSLTRTKSGAVFGTPAFMSPEQALGRVREVDAVTDVWAVGATAFTLLAGRYVHEGETAEEMCVRAATTPVPSLATVLSSVPAPIAAVIDRALAFDRSTRWPSAVAMRDALMHAREEAVLLIAEDYEDDAKTRIGPPKEMTLPNIRAGQAGAPTVPLATLGGVTSDSGARGRRFVVVVESVLRKAAEWIHRLGVVTAMERAGATIAALAMTNALRHRGRLLLTIASGLAVSFAVGAVAVVVARAHSMGSGAIPMNASAGPEPNASEDQSNGAAASMIHTAPPRASVTPAASETTEPTPAATPQPAPMTPPTPRRSITAGGTTTRTPPPATTTWPTPAPAPNPTAAPAPAKPDCTPPYTIDSTGHKHWKMQCL